MRREHYLARLLRGLSGMTQDQIAAEIGVHSSLVAQIELGQVLPIRAHLERMAGLAFFKLHEAEDVVDRMLRSRRGGHGSGRTAAGFAGLAERLGTEIDRIRRRLLALPHPAPPSQTKTGRAAGDLYARICATLLDESERSAARNAREAAALAALAAELAEQIEEPAGMRARLLDRAAAGQAAQTRSV
jgi:transcriptional regulator with XRE-family HTH domain